MRFIEPALVRAAKLFDRRLRKPAAIDAAVARLRADPEGAGAATADLVIEAVFEDLKVKRAVYERLEGNLRPGVVIATNTSSIPLEELAGCLREPGPEADSSTPPAGQTRALFTNFGYFALGVPRNRSAATADPSFFDMGLCGPVRTDLAHRTDLCGKFKVPTLRNVALTAPYFHNGAVATLQDAVSFYATRDIDPARWYPVVDGTIDKFNDLPAAYRGNVDQQPPFGQQPGQAPRLSAQDVQDLTAFLHTLTDGFVP